MIAHIRGIITEKIAGTIVVDVQGVGYELSVALGDFEAAQNGQEATFYTYHHIREQAEELFGFGSLAAKKLFQILIAVQGVGPKAALAILSLGSSEQVRNALAQGDAGFVQKAAGVGKKTAERIIVDVRDKVGVPTQFGATESTLTAPTPGEQPDEAREALMALGYTLADATKALEGIAQDLPTAERVRLALKG